jgi:hypothetical protein
MNANLCFSLAVFALTGCATMDANKASSVSTPELCQIVVLGNTPTVFYDSASRLEAEREAARRGINCMDYAQGIHADVQSRAAAIGGVGQAIGASTYAPAPVARTATRTSCQNLSNGTTACTTYFTSGPPQTTTCRTLVNGQTHCNH